MYKRQILALVGPFLFKHYFPDFTLQILGQYSWRLASLFCIGRVVGLSIISAYSERMSRRIVVVIGLSTSLISNFLLAFSPSIYSAYFSYLCVGISTIIVSRLRSQIFGSADDVVLFSAVITCAAQMLGFILAGALYSGTIFSLSIHFFKIFPMVLPCLSVVVLSSASIYYIYSELNYSLSTKKRISKKLSRGNNNRQEYMHVLSMDDDEIDLSSTNKIVHTSPTHDTQLRAVTDVLRVPFLSNPNLVHRNSLTEDVLEQQEASSTVDM